MFVVEVQSGFEFRPVDRLFDFEKFGMSRFREDKQFGVVCVKFVPVTEKFRRTFKIAETSATEFERFGFCRRIVVKILLKQIGKFAAL